MIGWRKTTAWALVFVLVAVSTYFKRDVPINAMELLKYATGFFFGANVIKPLMKGSSVNIGQAAK